MEITAAAATALINVGTNRQGAPLSGAGITTEVLMELRDAGLIGRTRGLTRKGTIVRERLMEEALEKAFGA